MIGSILIIIKFQESIYFQCFLKYWGFVLKWGHEASFSIQELLLVFFLISTRYPAVSDIVFQKVRNSSVIGNSLFEFLKKDLSYAKTRPRSSWPGIQHSRLKINPNAVGTLNYNVDISNLASLIQSRLFANIFII